MLYAWHTSAGVKELNERDGAAIDQNHRCQRCLQCPSIRIGIRQIMSQTLTPIISRCNFTHANLDVFLNKKSLLFCFFTSEKNRATSASNFPLELAKVKRALCETGAYEVGL